MLIYVVIILLYSKTSTSEPHSGFEENLQQYITVYQSRVSQNYTCCNLVYKTSSNASKNLVNWFASRNDCPNIIARKTGFKSSVRYNQGDFHFFESLKEVRASISKLPNDFFCNEDAEAHFIINANLGSLSFLVSTFKFLWERHFVNCVIVFIYEKLQIFSYDAFQNRVLNLTACGRCPLFSSEMGNFWGHTLRVNMYVDQPLLRKIHGKWIGRDYEIMTEVVKTLNVSLQIIETTTHFAGAIDNLAHNETDICFVSTFLLSHPRFKDIDCSYPEHFNNLVLMVPSGQKIPQYQNLFYIFDMTVWITLILMMLCAAFVIKRLASCDNSSKTYVYYLLDVWRSFLQQGLWNFSRTYHKAKLVVVLWSSFSLIFGTSFQTSLMSMFIKSKYFKNIDTISEAREWGLAFFVPGMYAEVIPKEYGLHEQFKVIRDMGQIHELIYTFNGFAGYIMHEEAAHVYVKTIKNTENKPMYHIVGERLVPGIDTYMFQKKSPYIRRVNTMLLLLRQFGLRNNLIGNPSVINENSRRNIGISNLQGALCLLGLGYIISVSCFIVELLINIIRKIDRAFQFYNSQWQH